MDVAYPNLVIFIFIYEIVYVLDLSNITKRIWTRKGKHLLSLDNAINDIKKIPIFPYYSLYTEHDL